MENWILPFIITVIYTIFTIVIGILPGRKMDMTQHKNWGVAGATMGPLMLFFMLGGSQISAYTFMGAPGTAWSASMTRTSFSPQVAERIMPLLSSPIILRGARLETMTTLWPIKSSGLYHWAMPERICRFSCCNAARHAGCLLTVFRYSAV